MTIQDAKYLGDYKLELTFSNGETRIADFEQFLKQSFHPSNKQFLDKELFKIVEIDTGFLSWKDGEMEISATSAYSEFSQNLSFKNAS